MISIVAQSDVHHVVTDEFPPLDDDIRALCGQRVRRVDRYIQLCLLGALRCTEGHRLPADTGIFLASQNNAIGSIVKTMECIFDERYPPAPFDFVNTLGNSACFYVAQLLGLSGKSIVLSREGFSFEAGLYHALLDFRSGQMQTALVGCVDEVLLPLEMHRVRIAGENQPLVEGPLGESSSWLLLRARAEEPNEICLDNVSDFSSLDEVSAWLDSNSSAPSCYLQTCYKLSRDDRQALEKKVRSVEEYMAPFSVAGSGTHSAKSIMRLLTNTSIRDQHKTLLHLNKNADGTYVLAEFLVT